MMRRAERHHARDLRRAEAAQQVAHDEAAHAVPDDDDALCAGLGARTVDQTLELCRELRDRVQRRTVRKCIDRADVRCRELLQHRRPHARVAQHAMHEHDRQRRPRGCGIAHAQAIRHHPPRRADERAEFGDDHPQRAGQPDLLRGWARRALDPRQCEIEERDRGDQRRIEDRHAGNPRPRRRTRIDRMQREYSVDRESRDVQQPQR